MPHGDPARPARPAQGQDRRHHRRQPRHRPAARTLPGHRRRPRAALGAPRPSSRRRAEEIVEELRGVGYPKPEERVHILPDIDVGDEAALQRLFEHSIELFGHVDFLINNAGISGAEEMVVDMTLEDWNRTMHANLISNYSLIRKYAPR
jgi:NAD(P)-dependent dehydrogenase (short-subunit alcohol dehydrogenase family)